MLDFDMIKKRLTNIFKIGIGEYDKLSELDISPRGLLLSFQALMVACLPLILNIALSTKYDEQNSTVVKIIFGKTLIHLSSWFFPLILIFIFANILHIKSKLLAFTIAYNWLQAAISLCYVPLLLLLLCFPAAFNFMSMTFFLLTIFLYYVSYRVFDAALQENVIFTLGLFLLYFLSSTLAELTSIHMLG